MRSAAEIVERIETMYDPLGWQKEVLITSLDYDSARPYLVNGTKRREWERSAARDDDTLRANMRAYMGFAWEMVVGHRARSASRSVERMIAWLFVLGDDRTLELMMRAPYPQYGAPRLRVVCEAYGFVIPEALPVRRMCETLACRDGCEQGCGK